MAAHVHTYKCEHKATCRHTNSGFIKARSSHTLQITRFPCRSKLSFPTPVAAASSHKPSTSYTQTSAESIASTTKYDYYSVTSTSNSWWSRLEWELLLAFSAVPVPAAIAEEGLKYDSSRGEGLVKTLSGAAYIGLLLYFLLRVLNRRARKAREERLAGQGPVRTIFTQLIEKITQGQEKPKATAAAAFIGAVQAGLIGFGLFLFASKVEGTVYGQDLPNGYTARNIAITVRTIIVGLMYLATFTFSANAVGLTGLSIQLLLFPDSLPDDDTPVRREPQEPQLPKVTVTSSPDEIKAAFEAVARAEAGRSSSGGPVQQASSGTQPPLAEAVAAEESSEERSSSPRAMATSSSDSS